MVFDPAIELLLEEVHFEEVAHDPAGQWSKPHRPRLRVAAALITMCVASVMLTM